MALESLSTLILTSPAPNTKQLNTPIDSVTYGSLLNILDELVDHTHLFQDDWADYVAPHSNCNNCCDTCNI